MAKMETCLVFFYFLKQDRTVVLEGRSFDRQGYRLWRVICSKPQVASDSIKPTPWVSWDLDVCTPLFASVRLLSGTQLRQCCQLSWMATPCIPKNSNVYQKVTPFSQPFFFLFFFGWFWKELLPALPPLKSRKQSRFLPDYATRKINPMNGCLILSNFKLFQEHKTCNTKQKK